MNILFVGNSFTYYHQMPDMVWELAAKAGHSARIEQIAYGRYQLKQYYDPKDEHGLELAFKLRQEKWDYVVFQEQSAKPCLNREEFLESCEVLAKQVRAYGVIPVLYQTWSYRDQSEQLAYTGRSYRNFYLELLYAYTDAAERTDGMLVPVGTAFYESMQRAPEIQLICEDDFHPTLEGSYLAACMFYIRLFNAKSIPDYTVEGLSEQVCSYLRKTAMDFCW